MSQMPGDRGPYRRASSPLSVTERQAIRQQEPPECRCGCGEPAQWRAKRAQWGVYARGHFRAQLPQYWNREWLFEQYVENRRTFGEIAQDFGVADSTVERAARALGIEARNPSEAHVGRQAGAKNPAWKGGVADWAYASDWKVIARKIRDRDEWTCQDCGDCRKRWGAALHVHHIDGNKLNNDPANLISLCARCHYRRHSAGVAA